MDDVTVLDVLVRARELVKRGWCQNDFAQDKHGEQVSNYSNEACKFCAWGAIRNANYLLGGVNCSKATENEATLALTKAIDGCSLSMHGAIANWNDAPGRKKVDVLEAYDTAIEQEREREQNRASMA